MFYNSKYTQRTCLWKWSHPSKVNPLWLSSNVYVQRGQIQDNLEQEEVCIFLMRICKKSCLANLKYVYEHFNTKFVSICHSLLWHVLKIFLKISAWNFFHCKFSRNNFIQTLHLRSSKLENSQAITHHLHIYVVSKWDTTLLESVNDVATGSCILLDKHPGIT